MINVLFQIKATPVIVNKEIKQKPKKQSTDATKAVTNGRSSPASKQTEAAKTNQLLEKTEQLWSSEDRQAICVEVSQLFRCVSLIDCHHCVGNSRAAGTNFCSQYYLLVEVCKIKYKDMVFSFDVSSAISLH